MTDARQAWADCTWLQEAPQLRQMGLLGLGGPAPEEPDTSGRPMPADNKSSEPPKAFKGQGENDTEQRNEVSDSPPSVATRVCAYVPAIHCQLDSSTSKIY